MTKKSRLLSVINGVLCMATAILFTAKVTGHSDVSWWIVFLPLWPWFLFAGSLLVFGAVTLLAFWLLYHAARFQTFRKTIRSIDQK